VIVSSTTRNSSPPRRAIRVARAQVLAQPRRDLDEERSPASWPCTSLICLKPSSREDQRELAVPAPRALYRLLERRPRLVRLASPVSDLL